VFPPNHHNFSRNIKGLFSIAHMAVRALPPQPASAVSPNSGAMNSGFARKYRASCWSSCLCKLHYYASQIISYQTNKIDGNGTDGAPTGTIPMK
jgi:hypothetical protein